MLRIYIRIQKSDKRHTLFMEPIKVHVDITFADTTHGAAHMQSCMNYKDEW